MGRRILSQTLAGRPVVCGVRAPLTDASPEAWWEEEATRLGLSVYDLKEQVRLADEIIEEIVLADKYRES